jgi:hypothetical protein
LPVGVVFEGDIFGFDVVMGAKDVGGERCGRWAVVLLRINLYEGYLEVQAPKTREAP